MTLPLVPMLIAGGTTLLLLPLLIWLAPRVGLVDEPVGRKQHQSATPQVGGVAMMAGLLTLFVTMPELAAQFRVVLISAALLTIVGVVDDIRPIHSAVRMFIQIGVGCAIFVDLPFLSVGDIWFIGDLGLGPYALTFTCIAVVGGINAVNMMDGLDGLCGAMVSATLICFSGLAWYTGHEAALQLSLLLLTTLLVFLLFNYRFPWNPRGRVFLGDSGAYLLGFMIAALFLLGSQGIYKGQPQVLFPVTALWLLFIPLIDIAHVIWLRSRSGRWPVADDRRHVHYLLVDRGYSVPAVVNGLFVAALLLGSLGIALEYLGAGESWSYTVFMSCCVIYFIVTNRLANRLPLAGE